MRRNLVTTEIVNTMFSHGGDKTDLKTMAEKVLQSDNLKELIVKEWSKHGLRSIRRRVRDDERVDFRVGMEGVERAKVGAHHVLRGI